MWSVVNTAGNNMLARRRIPSVHAWTLTDQQLELRRPHRKQQLRLILDSRDTNYIIFCLFQSRSWLVIPLPLVFGSGTGLTAWTLSQKDSTKTALMFNSFSYPSASCKFFKKCSYSSYFIIIIPIYIRLYFTPCFTPWFTCSPDLYVHISSFLLSHVPLPDSVAWFLIILPVFCLTEEGRDRPNI